MAAGSQAERSSSSPPEGKWVVVGREDFQRLSFARPPGWIPDQPESASRFSDNGAFFHEHESEFRPPQAYRLSAPFGSNGFLALECYSLKKRPLKQMADIVPDPADPGNSVLRLASPDHTDGNILRLTQPLGQRYRICARVGYMRFGTGNGLNGYHGDESSGPWIDGEAVDENGFYFGAIFRSLPRPHNNLWSHHERIFFIDSDNNREGWTSIWDSRSGDFKRSGRHPVVIGMVDQRENDGDPEGPRFSSYAAGHWQERYSIRAVDAYQENTWYTVCYTRFDDRYTLSISGDFQYGGRTTYEVAIRDARAVPDFHGPHYWMMGDPHINYYEGSLLVDDVTLSTWS